MAFEGPTSAEPNRLDAHATYLFSLAIAEGWPGVLLQHLFEGCGVTIDAETRRPIFITQEEVDILGGGDG